MRVAVIGAGPSGLVTLKYLLEAHKALNLIKPIEVRCFESDVGVGGTFLARTYEDAELVSSKQLTTFSDFRAKDGDGDFLSTERYIEYLSGYCTHFNLWGNISFRTTVTAIYRGRSGGHIVVYKSENSEASAKWECDAVAVCSGLHLTPNIPKIPGLDKIPVVLHSSKLKRREQFGSNKTVLVIGSGETGADIAYLAVTSPTSRVILSHRDGFHFAPQRNLNPALLPILGGQPRKEPTTPVDHGRASLFDTAYVHPILRNHDYLLWSFYDAYVKSITWLTTGTSIGIDQWIGEVSAYRNHVSKLFFNKAGRKVNPFISAPYRPKKPSLINRIRSSLIQGFQAQVADHRGRIIELAPLPEHIDDKGVIRFRDNGRPEYQDMKDKKVKPDIAVLCTGYNQEFPFLTDSVRSEAGEIGDKLYPQSSAEADVRNIWKRDDPTIGFIGFVRPSLGAIPPLSEMQAQLWILQIAVPQRVPPLDSADEHHYRLHSPKTARIQYGVDHESYVYQLALDMDSALGFVEALRLGWRWGWRLPIVWALSANLVTKFRVRGPWQWDGAKDVMMSEMWESVRKRRLFYDNFLLSFMPMAIFGPLSLACYIFAPLINVILERRETGNDV